MELNVGRKASRSNTLAYDDVKTYAETTGDYNPLHFDENFAAKTRFQLLETAVPGSVSLTVNGVPCEAGWVLGETGPLVKFDADAACLPNSGDEVKITYEMVCLEDLP